MDTILGSDWSTRRGDFHKYCLRVVLQGPGEAAGEGRRSKEHLLQRSRSKKPPPPDEICLPKDVTEHVSDNLKPGECYQVRAGNEPSRSLKLKFYNHLNLPVPYDLCFKSAIIRLPCEGSFQSLYRWSSGP